LYIQGTSPDDKITEFPHDLDGGWPDVDPTDAFVVYAQIQDGPFSGVSAMATGPHKKKRSQGVALALVLAAATLFEDIFPDEVLLSFHHELPVWIAEAKQLGLQHSKVDQMPMVVASESESGSDQPIKREAAVFASALESGSNRPGRRAELRSGRHADRGEASLDELTEVEVLRKELRAAELELAGAKAEVDDARAEADRSQLNFRLERNAMHQLRFAELSYEHQAVDAVKMLHEAQVSLDSERDLVEQLREQLRKAEAERRTW
jgi:hypothetical protein